ncbi:hypothetical protein Tco_0512355 [Tanacetum coccineum]
MAPLPGISARSVEVRLMMEIVGVVPMCGDPLEDGVHCQRCTCKWCGYGLREGFCLFCASKDGNSSIDAPNPNSFNDPPNVFTHPLQTQYESYSCELCGNDAHYGYDSPPRVPHVYELEPGYDNYYPQNLLSFPQQYLNCEKCGGPHEDDRCQPWHQNYSELNPCYDSNSYGFDQPTQFSINHQPQSIHEDLNQQRMNDVLKAPSRHFNFICYDDDDDKEITIPLNKIVSQISSSIAIIPVLLTMEPEDSLIMGDEYLSTIPEKESDEFIKSSVDDLVPIPSESEDMSNSNSECDLPFCDNFVTFSNPLFNDNDDFTSSDDKSLLEEDVPDDVNPLFNEVLEDIESEDSYVYKLDEPALLVTPLSDANEDECFDPGGEIDKIDAFLDMDISTDIENGYHDSEGDIIYLESLLIKDTIPNLPLEVFLHHDPKSLNNKSDNLKSMVKVFDPGIWEKNFSPTYVKLPFEDRHYLSLTYVIRIFLPYFTYPVDSSLPFSSGSEDIIFDPGVFAYSFYSLELVANGSPMEI